MIANNTTIGKPEYVTVEITIPINKDDLEEVDDWFDEACCESQIDMNTTLKDRPATEEEIQEFLAEDEECMDEDYKEEDFEDD